jgi:transposase-like protein
LTGLNLRRIASLTLLLSFVLCILTSIVLFIMPHGRVAFWSNWKLWGLDKTQWSDLHVNLGILFLLAGLLHLFYNWKPITLYLKNRARKLRLFTVDFNIALVLVLIVGLGTLFHLPPMGTILRLEEAIKNEAGIRYGEPPYGHAELSSLKMFAHKTDLDLDKARELLKQAGIRLASDKQTISEIARDNHLTPKQLYEIIKPAALRPQGRRVSAFPASPSPGFGRRQLSGICAEFDLDPAVMVKALAAKGIKARPEQTFKDIARENGVEPMTLFELLREAANGS